MTLQRYTHQELVEWLKTHQIIGGVDEINTVTGEELANAEEKEETPAAESGEEGEAEDTPSDDEPTAEELKQATNLYKLLKNPATAQTVIRSLAEQNGLLNTQTKTETTTAKKAIKDLVAEGLGPAYAFLAPQLTSVIESVLGQEREERTTQISQLEHQQVEKDVESALSRLARDTKGESRKIESKMMGLMQKFQPGPGTTVEEYIRGIYAQATAGRTAKTTAAQMTDRIKRNANDAPSRLQNTSTGTGTRSAPSGKMNLKASVEAALASINKGQK